MFPSAPAPPSPQLHPARHSPGVSGTGQPLGAPAQGSLGGCSTLAPHSPSLPLLALRGSPAFGVSPLGLC